MKWLFILSLFLVSCCTTKTVQEETQPIYGYSEPLRFDMHIDSGYALKAASSQGIGIYSWSYDSGTSSYTMSDCGYKTPPMSKLDSLEKELHMLWWKCKAVDLDLLMLEYQINDIIKRYDLQEVLGEPDVE